MRRPHKDGSDPSPFGTVMLLGGVILGGVGLVLPTFIDSLGQPGGTSPVTVEVLYPKNGATISNTVPFEVNASSLAGPIVRVEYYVDGKLFAVTGSNGAPIPMPPTGVRVNKP